MSLTRSIVSKPRFVAALACLLVSLFSAPVAQSATVFFQTGTTGSGVQTAATPTAPNLTTPISGTMTASSRCSSADWAP
jgi:hypothetical protein